MTRVGDEAVVKMLVMSPGAFPHLTKFVELLIKLQTLSKEMVSEAWTTALAMLCKDVCDLLGLRAGRGTVLGLASPELELRNVRGRREVICWQPTRPNLWDCLAGLEVV